MAFDGVTVAAVAAQLNQTIAGGRLAKIAQPENDELLLTVKTPEGNLRLLLSSDASFPLALLTQENKPSPLTAPNFCMLLRKHLANGRILSVTQPGLERVLRFEIEHLDELGDLCRKFLIVEIMGKHSNIIFCGEDGRILDAIKHVSAAVSSVREVLPGKPYFIPKTQEKLDLLACPAAESTGGFPARPADAPAGSVPSRLPLTPEEFTSLLRAKPQPLYKALYGSFTGFSPILAQELCFRAGLDGDLPAAAFSDPDYDSLYQETAALLSQIRTGSFTPCIAYHGKQPAEYAATELTMYAGRADRNPDAPSADAGNSAAGSDASGDRLEPAGSISEVLERFYRERSALSRIRQRSSDLRHILQTALERDVRKLELQTKQIRDTEKRDTYRVYGELLNTYGYSAEPGAKKLTVPNYYTGEDITIPLDETLTAAENAQRYFDRYGKLKRTYEALDGLTGEVRAEIAHLESILAALDIARTEDDLSQIREEMAQSGYIGRGNAGAAGTGSKNARKGGSGKNGRGGRNPKARSPQKFQSKPFHYISTDGYDIYVGRNNLQNDELTFRFANGGDWWFHAKKIPGSHVILRAKGTEIPPDRAFEEAARLAAYYSKGREQEKTEIDYVLKKEVKKPAGAKPGFVVYYTNYSMATPSDISMLKELP